MVAPDGDALLRPGDKPDAAIQVQHVRAAGKAVAPLANGHELLICQGKSPQVVMLSGGRNRRNDGCCRPDPLTDRLLAGPFRGQCRCQEIRPTTPDGTSAPLPTGAPVIAEPEE